jgi:hypothetical protein
LTRWYQNSGSEWKSNIVASGDPLKRLKSFNSLLPYLLSSSLLLSILLSPADADVPTLFLILNS